MDNAVYGCDGGLGEMMISEFHCVGDLCRLVGFFRYCVEAVVL